jgi:hypothetical protein
MSIQAVSPLFGTGTALAAAGTASAVGVCARDGSMNRSASEGHDEDLAVADLAGAGGGRDRIDHAGDQIGGHGHLDLELGQEAHGVLGAPVDLGMAFLPAIALHLGDGQAVDADAGQSVADLLQLERLDDGHHDFHGRRPLKLRVEFDEVNRVDRNMRAWRPPAGARKRRDTIGPAGAPEPLPARSPAHIFKDYANGTFSPYPVIDSGRSVSTAKFACKIGNTLPTQATRTSKQRLSQLRPGAVTPRCGEAGSCLPGPRTPPACRRA